MQLHTYENRREIEPRFQPLPALEYPLIFVEFDLIISVKIQPCYKEYHYHHIVSFCRCLFSGDRSEPVSAEISFYSRGGSIPCSLKAQVTATYVTNSGEFTCIPFS